MPDKNAQNTALARTGQSQTGGMTRWSPWDEFATLRHQMDDLFTRAFGYTPLSQMIPNDMRGMDSDVDVHETDENVTVYASMPGYAPDQIDVQATGDTLTIHAERQPLHQDEKATARGQGRASGYSRFDATFTLPAEIDPNNIKASFRNGVLQLDMP